MRRQRAKHYRTASAEPGMALLWLPAGGGPGGRSPCLGLLPLPCESSAVHEGDNYLSGHNMFIFRHADVSWGHGLIRSSFMLFATSERCLTGLERRAGAGVAAASNTCCSVLGTSWGWLSWNNKGLGLFIKKICLFFYYAFTTKAVAGRRGDDAKLIVGVAPEVCDTAEVFVPLDSTLSVNQGQEAV